MVAIPLWASVYWVRIATNVPMYVALTAAYNIVAGYTRYPVAGSIG